MKTKTKTDFDKISEAIGYISANFRGQPDLDMIAKKVGLSPSHFQKLFTKWAGTSPKKFLQYISLEYAKKLLKEEKSSVLGTTVKTGLSSGGRLHDLFISIEGMTPGEFKNGGENLKISYCFAESPFGNVLIAATTKGIVYISFVEKNNEKKALKNLRAQFPKAIFNEKRDAIIQKTLKTLQNPRRKEQIKLHIKGTPFQLKVWEALLKIPAGKVSTYGNIAKKIGNSKANRAVGSAVGKNPVAILIPCHRVIQSSGVLGNYHWGSDRKKAMIGWEGIKN